MFAGWSGNAAHGRRHRMAKLKAAPITIKEANEIVEAQHRHNLPVHGAKFAIACTIDGEIQGCAIVDSPVSRFLDDGFTAEVVRCCVFDDAPKGACSFLYACCWRAWRAMGGTKIITYTLQTESGASMRGAGWTVVHESAENKSTGWQTRENRKMQDVSRQPKFRWEMS